MLEIVTATSSRLTICRIDALVTNWHVTNCCVLTVAAT